MARRQADWALLASLPEPEVSAHSGDDPSRGTELRMKLDRRIHNQRKALRDNWEIVEQRQRSWRWLSRNLIRKAIEICDLAGIPDGSSDGGSYTLFRRLDLLAEKIRDSDASLAEDPQGLSGEAVAARAERHRP